MRLSTFRTLTAFTFVASVSLALAVPALLYAAPQSLSSGLGATSVNRDFPTCMNQTYGRHEKLTAEVLQGKLSSGKLTAQQRRETEEDIKWLNAIAGGAARNLPAPDPRNPQRYLLVLTDAEQVEINRKNSLFMNETRNKCEAQYGGMSQFADPSGRRGNAATSTDSAPPPADPSPVTAKLREAGTTNGNPFDATLWFSDTYVRTPAGWKYVFGQSSLPLPKPTQ